MNKPAVKNLPKSSRLLRNLSELDVLGHQPTESQFGSRLGRLIDLSDSIALADTLRQVSKGVVAPESQHSERQGEALKAEFLERRSAMVAFIVGSFSARSGLPGDEPAQASFNLPKLSEDILGGEGFKPYQRFYALHQSEMELQVGSFLAAAKAQVSAADPKLKRVVTLDSALFETLQGYCRKQLAQVSSLLGRRFDVLRASAVEAMGEDPSLQDKQQWLAPTGWLSRFYREMQNLLLAELDLRLQPLLGLIEACEYEELNQR